MAQQENYFIGIDLSDAYAQISYCIGQKKEPESVSMVAGEEAYCIPTVLCRRKEDALWQLMDSKGARSRESEICVEHLLAKSRMNETIVVSEKRQERYEARELLLVFLKKLIRLVPGLTEFSQISALAFHLEEIDQKSVRLLCDLMERLHIPKERVKVLDSGECFCYFSMNQEQELMLYDNVLFECNQNHLTCLSLSRTKKTVPQQIQIATFELGELPVDPLERDQVFSGLVNETLKGKIVSAVYLCGDGFEGEWIQQSLAVLCRGRRVFQGRNLYGKGACYGSIPCKKEEFVYFGENQLKHNVFLKVRNREQSFVTDLAEAGSRYFDISGSCQVLLSGEAQIDIWLKNPQNGETKVEQILLTDLPKRPDKMTRLSVEVTALEKRQLLVKISDLGFGSWYPSSGKVWEYTIND